MLQAPSSGGARQRDRGGTGAAGASPPRAPSLAPPSRGGPAGSRRVPLGSEGGPAQPPRRRAAPAPHLVLQLPHQPRLALLRLLRASQPSPQRAQTALPMARAARHGRPSSAQPASRVPPQGSRPAGRGRSGSPGSVRGGGAFLPVVGRSFPRRRLRTGADAGPAAPAGNVIRTMIVNPPHFIRNCSHR